MRRLRLVIPLMLVAAVWLYGCDGESPSAPEATTETVALFGKVPTNPTACYTAGMVALEAAETYGEAAKDLAKCDQKATGPCDDEQQVHTDAWTALMAAYDAAVTACGGGTPPTGDQDGDGVLDADDDCPTGETGWISDANTDFDGDGCRDAGEDIDDDNDGVLDVADYCPLEPGVADNDGCPPGVCGGTVQCGLCQLCESGSCVNVPRFLDPNDECGSGLCDGNGGCLTSCTSNADCSADNVCVNNACVTG